MQDSGDDKLQVQVISADGPGQRPHRKWDRGRSQGEEQLADTSPGSFLLVASYVTLDRPPPPRRPVGNCEIMEGAPSVACQVAAPR